MAMNDKIGQPIPKGIVGGTALVVRDEDAADMNARMAEIRDEISHLGQMVAGLADTATRYTKLRLESAAQNAVDRHPLGSLVVALLAGYWLAGRRR
jgi:hypothetical protein